MISNYTGISGSRIAYLAAAELKNKGKALIVVSTVRVAERLAEDLAFFVPDAKLAIMPEEEDVQVLYEARNRESLVQRIRGIQALASENQKSRSKADDATTVENNVAEEKLNNDTGAACCAVIAPISAVMKLTGSRARFESTQIELRIGQQIDPNEIKRRLVLAGYEAVSVTDSAGEFSSRGGILDVFSPSYLDPVRIEFFDDEIDSIRFYDKDTQRSIKNVRGIVIGPAAEFIPSEEERSDALDRIRKEYDRRIKEVLGQHSAEGIRDGRVDRLTEHRERVTGMFENASNIQIFADYLSYFNVDKHYLWEYMDDGISIICDPARLLEEIPSFQNKDDFKLIYNTDCSIYTPFPESINGLDRMDSVINVKSRQIASFNGQLELFAKELGDFSRNGYRTVLVSSTEDRMERIREYVDLTELQGDISYCIGKLSAGMVFEDDKLCYITEGDIFPRFKKPAPSRRKKSGEMLRFSDLHKGDYVVHETHGVGRFEGIKPMTVDGLTRDYLVIRYAGSDVLYIPTEQLDIIQKYIGSGGNAPSLSKLSGGSWRRTRERVRKAVMEIAEDLVKLYAARRAAGGYAFAEDSVWQREFEADFPYTETDDQLRAIEEIKEDMQKPLPMDRLLCGDVGYGKTEVAARAIFKCISEGKQAAILAPTTLLVNQHYHNLKERFANFPFEINELSRFKTSGQQAETIKGLKEGRVDLVIGTHRLLSDDIQFKDFGLLVIDEEQRFGVQHKEKIKKLRHSVDVLTLSATPIPRTLNMSLTGIKDISTISEPPGERYPVQTYVTPFDEELLKSVIERELSRGGQVFVVNNRIAGLRTIAEEIKRLVPTARVAIGHGQMSEETLENTMLDFIDGESDVLVATTIIENGIDIPNANTIVILNADRLGLAQLYQLRGRVGRSNRLAYAYLMYQPQKVLTEIAVKRLTAIREFTEFGAGFKLAMRDLELRGAGNILGEAQSGHIEGIGYELYCKEVDRAVRRLKGEKVTETRADISIEIAVQASIPEYYINDESLRLQAYKKIAEISCQQDADDMFDEMLDRYGDVPDETLNLIHIAEIRAHSECIGAVSIVQRDTRFLIKFGEENRLNAYMLIIAREAMGDKLTITSGNPPGLNLYAGKLAPLDSLLSLLRSLKEAYDSSQEADIQV